MGSAEVVRIFAISRNPVVINFLRRSPVVEFCTEFRRFTPGPSSKSFAAKQITLCAAPESHRKQNLLLLLPVNRRIQDRLSVITSSTHVYQQLIVYLLPIAMDETRSQNFVNVADSIGHSVNGIPSSTSLNRDEIEAVHFLADSLMRISPQDRASQIPTTNGHTASNSCSSSLANNQLWSDDFIRKLGNSLAYTVNRHSSKYFSFKHKTGFCWLPY